MATKNIGCIGSVEVAIVNKENEPPVAKKPRNDRWQFTNEEEQQNLCKKFTPRNTASSTKWALSNFNAWKASRNERFKDTPEGIVPDDLLVMSDPVALSKWLTCYVAETRKHDGTKYPPRTIYSLLSGLLRYSRDKHPNALNFLCTEDTRFHLLHNALDNVMRELRTEGVGSVTKSAEVFTKEDENKLWNLGILGIHSPKALLRAVFFFYGKNLCLREEKNYFENKSNKEALQ